MGEPAVSPREDEADAADEAGKASDRSAKSDAKSDAKAKDGWTRGRKVRVAVAVAALVVVAGVAAWLLSPIPFQPYEDPVSAEHRSQNANLVAALFSGGIEDPFVDVDDERVYVAYALPDHAYDNATGVLNATVADQVQRFVVGASANAAPDVTEIVVTQYDGTDPLVVWVVQMEDFKAFVNTEIDLDEFEARIERTDL